jgi:hypothetical protein
MFGESSGLGGRRDKSRERLTNVPISAVRAETRGRPRPRTVGGKAIFNSRERPMPTPRKPQNDRSPRVPDRSSHEPDILLDVPAVKVDEIDLKVDDLQARVALHADLLDVLNLHVGADVALRDVTLEIRGAEAQALLNARLDNVAAIVDRVLTAVEDNPQLVELVTRRTGNVSSEARTKPVKRWAKPDRKPAWAAAGPTESPAKRLRVPEKVPGKPQGTSTLPQTRGPRTSAPAPKPVKPCKTAVTTRRAPARQFGALQSEPVVTPVAWSRGFHVGAPRRANVRRRSARTACAAGSGRASTHAADEDADDQMPARREAPDPELAAIRGFRQTR